MDAKELKQKINKAFRILRKDGYFAKQNLGSTQTECWSRVPDGEERVVFYHIQDLDRFKESGELFLAWSGDGYVIANAFESVGLNVEWNGSEYHRIIVSAPK